MAEFKQTSYEDFSTDELADRHNNLFEEIMDKCEKEYPELRIEICNLEEMGYELTKREIER